MKKIVGLLFIISLFLIGGCSRDTITSPPLSKAAGTVSLQIDKTNAPQNVVSIVAYLSRASYDTLKGDLNLLSDTSADILIQNIPAGQWHLTINAVNDSSMVVYSGETDVEIMDGIITQVSLTLMPTGKGTGNIYIMVNWGTSQTSWIDYINNPILTSGDNPSNPLAVSQSKVYFDNGTYKMWYNCMYPSGKFNIWYAESQDGINWHTVGTFPALTSNTDSTWDGFTVAIGEVLKDGNSYKMYYSGWSNWDNQMQIGLATSTDGLHWNKYPDPVLLADNTNEYKVGVQSVLKINGQYYMYYSSSPINNYWDLKINLALSNDGIHWTKYSNNPILRATESWEGVGISYPSVIYDNNRFVMIYQNTDRTKLGIAYSNDGINWKKSQNYIFSTKDMKKNFTSVEYPELVKFNSEYRIYYSANSSYYNEQICFAKTFSLQ